MGRASQDERGPRLSPVPMFATAIVKLTSYCDLACDYCYMFESQDRTFTRIPKKMDIRTSLRMVDFVSGLRREFKKPKFAVVLHGGEPSLWGYSRFERLLEYAADVDPNLEFSVQSNLASLNLSLIQLFSDHKVRIGVSIDGPAAVHDAHRRDLRGRPSYNRIIGNIQKIQDAGLGHTLSGVLSVADPLIPAKAFWTWALSLPLPRLDVLWPFHYNWDAPPWGFGDNEDYKRNPKYGLWMSELFYYWVTQSPYKITIRSFFDLVGYFLGSNRFGDGISNDTLTSFVVNTDGQLELSDYIRSHRDGASRTQYNIESCSLQEFISDERFDFYLKLGDHLPSKCTDCPHELVCGGGILSGRFRSKDEFPVEKSVMCYDQMEFFSRVKEMLQTVVPASTRFNPKQVDRASSSIDLHPRVC